MLKDIKFHKYVLLAWAILLVLASADTSFAQDLGSSSGLFKAKKAKSGAAAAKPTAKKTVAKKPASPVAAKRNAAKTKTAASRTAQQIAAKSKSSKKSAVDLNRNFDFLGARQSFVGDGKPRARF